MLCRLRGSAGAASALSGPPAADGVSAGSALSQSQLS